MRQFVDCYEIKSELGAGGFGTVYAAIDRNLERWVAIKALHAEFSGNADLLERFQVEARSLARLNHPNITTLHRMFQDGREWFLDMELIRGQTLEKILHTVGRLGVNESLAVIAQASLGLGYANRQGVIHRDVKPANLMLTDSGHVKVMDFGIARVRGSARLTRAGTVGTFAYLAPEQFRGGEGTERSDLYALACVLYEMLSGEIPFGASTEAEMVHRHLEVMPRSLRATLPDLDPRIDDGIQRALAKNPDERFPGIEAFSEAIGASAMEKQSSDNIRAGILARLPPPPTRLVDLDFATTDGPASPGLLSVSGASRFKLPRLTSAPVVTVGIAAVLLVAGASYVLFNSGAPSFSIPTSPRGPDRVQAPVRDADASSPAAVAPEKPAPPPVEPAVEPPRRFADLTPPVAPIQSDSRTISGEELVNKARDLAAKGFIDQATTELRRAINPPYSYSPAMIAMAHLLDPTQPGRPTEIAADPMRAAMYYRDANQQHEASGVADRQRLYQYIKSKADGGDVRAQLWIERYWP